MRARSNVYIPWSSLLFALLGLAWCGYILFPSSNPVPCATSGCVLFRDGFISGVSLWWVGGLHFFLLALVCLRGNRSLARFMALAALFLDSLLLVVMLFTAPCFDCLVAAVFLGLTYYCLCYGGDGWFVTQQAPSLLLPVWFGLFLGNALLTANEQIPLHTLGNARSTDVRIFFSPSCEACRSAILMSGNAAALYPVEEQSGDLDSILRLRSLLKSNVPMREALARSLRPDEPVPHLPFYERLFLSAQLMRNKAVILRQGFRALPVIQINGMPVDRTPPEKIREPGSRPGEGRGNAPNDSAPHPAPPPGDSAPAGGEETPRPDAVPGNADGQPPQPQARPDAEGAERPASSPARTSADQTRSARARPDAADENPANLPDFLLQGSDELSRCSRVSGRPCD